MLSGEFGRGFDASNLRYMRLFYQAVPICDVLRHELSWTHYRTLLKVGSDSARQWYMNEAAAQNGSPRALARRIGTLYYERLLASQDRAAVEQETVSKLQSLGKSPREFVRDPLLLEFLGLPKAGTLLESELEQALIGHLQYFLLGLGKGFAFIDRQQRISTESKDFYVDLVFYNYLLKCFVIFDLKRGERIHQDIGQMDIYVRMYDDLKRGPEDDPTVGIILCAQRSASLARYSVLQGSEQLSPASTSWYCRPRKSCVPSWIVSGRCWRSSNVWHGATELTVGEQERHAESVAPWPQMAIWP